MSGRDSTRQRLLSAAADVAREQGSGNLSLDAIALRAGVSKGGLLYHFPTKAALLRELVQHFIDEFEARLETATRTKTNGNALAAYVHLTEEECAKPSPGAAGVLAATVEDPDFLKPVKAFQRRLLDRFQGEKRDLADVLLIYLALEGLRSMNLFEIDILSKDEIKVALQAMLSRAGAP